MSIRFNWPSYIEWEPIQKQVKQLLNEKIKENAPQHPALVGPVSISDIHFGNSPPIIKLAKLDELNEKKARVHIYIKYDGSASITVSTRIQINKITPLYESTNYLSYSQLGKSLLSGKPMEVPLDLTIYNIGLDGTIQIEYDFEKEVVRIQLLNHILNSVQVKSNFDENLAVVSAQFQVMVSTGANDAVKQLMQQPIEIPISKKQDTEVTATVKTETTETTFETTLTPTSL